MPVAPQLLTLAAKDPATAFRGVLIPCAVLLGLLVVFWIAAAFARRRAREMSQGDLGMAFSPSALRRMHAEGKLTDAELERALGKVVGQAGGTRLRTQVTAAEEDVELGPNLLQSPPDNDSRDSRTGDSTDKLG
ncbi:MAG: hypothetical protein GC162_16130 [Planctomycetes bacterium]|nr:hypothetical protein [Planctomycetota bacterium]